MSVISCLPSHLIPSHGPSSHAICHLPAIPFLPSHPTPHAPYVQIHRQESNTSLPTSLPMKPTSQLLPAISCHLSSHAHPPCHPIPRPTPPVYVQVHRQDGRAPHQPAAGGEEAAGSRPGPHPAGFLVARGGPPAVSVGLGLDCVVAFSALQRSVTARPSPALGRVWIALCCVQCPPPCLGLGLGLCSVPPIPSPALGCVGLGRAWLGWGCLRPPQHKKTLTFPPPHIQSHHPIE